MQVTLTEEECALQQQARSFAREHIKPNAMEYVQSGDYPWPILERAAEDGLIGLWFDEAYGGASSSLTDQCIVDEEFCRGNSSVGLALHSAVVGCYPVQVFGTDEQKERLLPPIARGEATTSFGITEPKTGSSLSEVSTTAERDGDEYVINGEKRWVGNGTKSDWVATLVRTDPNPDAGHKGLSIIVVPTDSDGYKAEPLNKCGLNAMDHGQMVYDDVRVPVDNLVGQKEGQGFYQVLDWLNQGHGRITVAAAQVGMAQGALDRAREYAENREQGGQPVSEYQGMRWKFADMKTKVELARAQTYRAAKLVDAIEDGEEVDESIIEQASIAKLFASEMSCDIAEEAVQVHGGNGFAVEYEVEHIYRDVKAGTLYEGTSEVLRNTIGKTVFGEL